jgi:pyruvate dehydrogenase E2 component (dihydrolipoamide acetyltransferase)
MAREFKLPDLGEGIHEGEIVEVFVAAGDQVKEGDPLMEVETDKAVTAIPSPFTGEVVEVRVKAGDAVQVGDVLVIFEAVAAEAGGEKEFRGKAAAKPAKAAEAQAGKPGRAVAAAAKIEDPEERAGAVEGASVLDETRGEVPAGDGKVVKPKAERDRKRPVPASPATRRLARELEVDLYEVGATGPEGLVTAEDVRRHAAAGGPTQARGQEEAPTHRKDGPVPALRVPTPNLPDFAQWGPVERQPLKSVRRATARQMALAWSQIPHVSNQGLVDVTVLEALRKRRRAEVETDGGRLTLTVFALKAAAAALKRHPRFNATIDMEGGEVILKRYYHIGVGVDTARGLLVPVIRDVDRKSIRELAVDLHETVSRAREGKTAIEEMQGGTFTITNAGAVGGGHFSPIINFPEAAILGMGRAKMQPVVRQAHTEGYEIVPRLMMPLVVCFDHRVADGADAIHFMQTIVDCLENPETLLLNA